MKRAQILLSVDGAKHLIARALIKKLDFSKRIYIAYGSTNEYVLYHLGIELDRLYCAGCNVNSALNVTRFRDKPIVLEDGKVIDISEFRMDKNSVLIKGANALWYEGDDKCAAVFAADEKGGTYGNFYVKAACLGSEIIIPVGHEKLIPHFEPVSQNVDFATGEKIATLRFFKGEVFTEIEAFETLFNLKARIIGSGGIFENQGSTIFLVEGEKAYEAVTFANEYNGKKILKKGGFIH